jgi:uncharacterized repeat protein (TIGR04042 family)
MPEMRFIVRWPDGEIERCYSPSTVVRDALEPGRDYPVSEFLESARAALEVANERVRARFGMGCAQAVNQITLLESRAADFAGQPGALVRVEGFEP